MFERILDLADADGVLPPGSNDTGFSVPDAWGKVKKRVAVAAFAAAVKERSRSACVVCGTAQPGLLDAAHLSPYASDPHNRANPANGIYLCAFCHRALDCRLIAIRPDEELLVFPSLSDPIAKEHFTRLRNEIRKPWLVGVGKEFLELTVQWFNDSLANRGRMM